MPMPIRPPVALSSGPSGISPRPPRPYPSLDNSGHPSVREWEGACFEERRENQFGRSAFFVWERRLTYHRSGHRDITPFWLFHP